VRDDDEWFACKTEKEKVCREYYQEKQPKNRNKTEITIFLLSININSNEMQSLYNIIKKNCL
jgi:hypothetical protein